ncbi:hypothetical protein B0H10DRAFT_2226445 [Mycena sp. CBHHK59/15]|nr:hypothetical protein B0H10DRAFT_2226445 [Mycena sp. CBHHK59/15]
MSDAFQAVGKQCAHPTVLLHPNGSLASRVEKSIALPRPWPNSWKRRGRTRGQTLSTHTIFPQQPECGADPALHLHAAEITAVRDLPLNNRRAVQWRRDPRHTIVSPILEMQNGAVWPVLIAVRGQHKRGQPTRRRTKHPQGKTPAVDAPPRPRPARPSAHPKPLGQTPPTFLPSRDYDSRTRRWVAEDGAAEATAPDGIVGNDGKDLAGSWKERRRAGGAPPPTTKEEHVQRALASDSADVLTAANPENQSKSTWRQEAPRMSAQSRGCGGVRDVRASSSGYADEAGDESAAQRTPPHCPADADTSPLPVRDYGTDRSHRARAECRAPPPILSGRATHLGSARGTPHVPDSAAPATGSARTVGA